MDDKIFREREILSDAQAKGSFSTLLAFFRLSGPGWLQSAITLGSGSLVGALYLGMLGGTSMLWLQLVAIVIGVIMLSAIAYVTLSTNVRPYQAINDYVNPVLGVGWVAATILANMIWIMPQFSLCFDALDTSLLTQSLTEEKSVELNDRVSAIQAELAVSTSSEEKKTLETEAATIKNRLDRVEHGLGTSDTAKIYTSAVLAVVGLVFVLMSFNPGWMSQTFDAVLKLIVGMIVLCFVGVVYILAKNGSINWGEVMMGFIPNFSQWTEPAPAIKELLAQLDGAYESFWSKKLSAAQQSSMIGVTATAVGLNMTFMLPYSMLARGWDKPFRGLSRFELITAMAIPYLVVTTCIVIASAHAFHAKADQKYLSNDPAVMSESVLFKSTMKLLEERYLHDFSGAELAAKDAELNSEIDALEAQLKKLEKDDSASDGLKDKLAAAQAAKKQKIAEFAAGLPEAEKRIVPSLIKPNASQFSSTLKLLLGPEYEQYSSLIFGVGAFAMGFSTIVILSLINGYAFAEIAGLPNNFWARFAGAIVAIASGFLWFWAWSGESQTWLVILASTFGAILLPIAYISFFALMNSRRLLGDHKPTGIRMVIWNVLMFIGCAGAVLQAYAALTTQAGKPTGPYVIGGVIVFFLLAVIGFSATRRPEVETEEASS